MIRDEVLLHRYSETRDAGAFRELSERYADMVLGICLRVTHNRHDAEELCQECFLELARKSRTVRENLPGWLHAMATHRSMSFMRSRKRRMARERTSGIAEAGDESPQSAGEIAEIQSLIDRAIHSLGDDLRMPIVLHYLGGATQREVADRMKIDQATVSRRLDRGIEQIRQQLRQLGVVTSVTAVSTVLGQGSAQAASGSFVGTLAKIGVGGVGVTMAQSSSGGIAAKLPLLAFVAGNLFLILIVEWWILPIILLVEYGLLIWRPRWVRELMRAGTFGRDMTAESLNPFVWWTWPVPPPHWKQTLVGWSLVGSYLLGVAIKGVVIGNVATGIPVGEGIVAAFFLSNAARLGWRVWRHRNNRPSINESQPRITLKNNQSWDQSIWVMGLLAFAAICWLAAVEDFAFTFEAAVFWTLPVMWLIMVWRRIRAGRRQDANGATQPTEIVTVVDRGRLKYHMLILGVLALLTTTQIIVSIGMTLRHAGRITEPGYEVSDLGIIVMSSGQALVMSGYMLERSWRLYSRLPRVSAMALAVFSGLGLVLAAVVLVNAVVGL